MTTLTLLKARIADDLNRSDLTSQIAQAITDAINFWKPTRFFFNETRLATFNTTDGTSIYTSSEDADIPLFVKLDAVFINDGTHNHELQWVSPEEMEYLLDSQTSEGLPRAYTYFESSFRFYPIPDATYTVRPIGLIEKAAPASDDEASNVWMTEAFELIRCRAKLYLITHLDIDDKMTQIQLLSAAEQSALSKLRRESTKRAGGGRIVGTDF
jgi:hypothetical protein